MLLYFSSKYILHLFTNNDDNNNNNHDDDDDDDGDDDDDNVDDDDDNLHPMQGGTKCMICAEGYYNAFAKVNTNCIFMIT